MNYGNENIKNDSIGFFIDIFHPFRENSPYLFKGNILEKNITKTECCFKEYEPLCYKYCSAIDSISTLYKSIITLESTLYNKVNSKDREAWFNQREAIIWFQPTIVKNNTIAENESWFYVKRKPLHCLDFPDTVYLKHKLLNSYDNYFPKWHSRGNVSKLNFNLKLENNDLIECDEIMICFCGPYNLSSISLEPDEKGYDYIRFTNPFKLKVICKKGLSFYSSFPELERMQQTRIAILMIIIPLLLSWLLYIIRKIVHATKDQQDNLNTIA